MWDERFFNSFTIPNTLITFIQRLMLQRTIQVSLEFRQIIDIMCIRPRHKIVEQNRAFLGAVALPQFRAMLAIFRHEIDHIFNGQKLWRNLIVTFIQTNI